VKERTANPSKNGKDVVEKTWENVLILTVGGRRSRPSPWKKLPRKGKPTAIRRGQSSTKSLSKVEKVLLEKSERRIS